MYNVNKMTKNLIVQNDKMYGIYKLITNVINSVHKTLGRFLYKYIGI